MSDDSSFMSKHNPLGIHSLDGTELILEKTPRKAAIPVNIDDDVMMCKAREASYSFNGDQDDSTDSMPTAALNLSDLNISQPLASGTDKASQDPPLESDKYESNTNKSEKSRHPKQSCEEVSKKLSTKTAQKDIKEEVDRKSKPSQEINSNSVGLDFGESLKMDGLTRKSTITARRMPPTESSRDIPGLTTKVGPSSNPSLIQRLRSIRRKMSPTDIPMPSDDEDDSQLDDGLSADILKMIAFNPESPWLGFDEELSDVELETTPEPSSERNMNVSKRAEENTADEFSHNLLYTGSSPEVINPFYVATHRDNIEEASISASTLATDLSLDSPESKKPAPSYSADYVTNTPSFDDVVYGKAPAEPEKEVPHTPTIEETDPVHEDDRGRLFLQINKIVNLRGLPYDNGRNPKFTLSLDNGSQTVTTDPSALPAPGLNGQSTAKIGQEFELTVAKDLELVLTVAVSMDVLHPPPKASVPRRMAHHAPTNSVSSSINTASSTGGSPIKNMKNSLLRSPKKKQQQQRLLEQQEQEEQKRQKLLKLQEEEEERERLQYERDLKDFYRRSDLWRGITGPHGEYCRGYVFESHYEKDIYGKAKSYNVPSYNEWDKAISQGVPRPVCELQVTMMYVPKLYASEEIPRSLRECQQALERARNTAPKGCEGFLTQQGGDCVSIWRRRWFTLHEAELIAHHEATRKRRSSIHLDKAVSVKDTLSDDLWCIYEDRSFQISFKDGEDISFYADTVEARDIWVRALKEAIDSCHGHHRSWTDLVIEKSATSKADR